MVAHVHCKYSYNIHTHMSDRAQTRARAHTHTYRHIPFLLPLPIIHHCILHHRHLFLAHKVSLKSIGMDWFDLDFFWRGGEVSQAAT